MFQDSIFLKNKKLVYKKIRCVSLSLSLSPSVLKIS